jgi:hypothetical protein
VIACDKQIVAMRFVLLLRAVAQRELGLGWMAGVCNGNNNDNNDNNNDK